MESLKILGEGHSAYVYGGIIISLFEKGLATINTKLKINNFLYVC